MSELEIFSITKRYGSFKALDDVSLTVGSGQFVTLLGPSGSGKSTLLMCVAGFAQPDAGAIRLGGASIVARPPHRRNFGMVFQSYALFPHMTVGENVAYPLKLRKVPQSDRAMKVRAALAAVRMSGMEDRRIGELSGGQRQRVACARAIVFDPPVILMDEPLSALDKALREEMQIELKHLHDRLGRTFIYVTHDQREALTMSDRIAVMNRGRVVQVGSPKEIYEQPVTEFVARFVGDASLLPMPSGGGGPAGQLIVVRPEKLELGGGLECDRFCFRCTVREVIYQGDSVLVFMHLADGTELTLRRGTRSSTLNEIPSPGAETSVFLHRRDACFVSPEAGT